MSARLSFTVNGLRAELDVHAHATLLEVLRVDLGLTGTKEGCDDCECGACMVLVDGQPVNACSYPALSAADRAVLTVEGLEANAATRALQDALLEAGGVQCGFCTPGMLMSAVAFLASGRPRTDSEARRALAGNLCRCTGYARIVEAVLEAGRRADWRATD